MRYEIAEETFPATVPVDTEEPGEVIVPFVEPLVLPVTVPIPTTPLIVAVFFTNTRNPFVSSTLPSGTVKLL
jgi:hypothetical protein